MRRRARRCVGLTFVILGGVLLWLSPATWPGLLLVAAAVGLEVAGIALERRNLR
jgi:uncharacterized membrane protein YccC